MSLTRASRQSERALVNAASDTVADMIPQHCTDLALPSKAVEDAAWRRPPACDVALDSVCQSYCERLFSRNALLEWREAALLEKDEIEELEVAV